MSEIYSGGTAEHDVTTLLSLLDAYDMDQEQLGERILYAAENDADIQRCPLVDEYVDNTSMGFSMLAKAMDGHTDISFDIRMIAQVWRHAIEANREVFATLKKGYTIDEADDYYTLEELQKGIIESDEQPDRKWEVLEALYKRSIEHEIMLFVEAA